MTEDTRIIKDGAQALNDLAAAAHANAHGHGFYDDYAALHGVMVGQRLHALARVVERSMMLEQMAKIGAEVGEAVDAVQRGLTEAEIAAELADVIIRTIDLAEWMGVKIGDTVARKMAYNRTRPYKHGKEC